MSQTGNKNNNPCIGGLPLLGLIVLLILPAAGALAIDEPAVDERPRIGLVLGGGGARGAAHVGVLKVLEELRIPVDYIAGTSMGSIVGGLYASGMSAREIEREMLAMNWDDLFTDAPARADRSFRRKRDDDFYTIKAKVGIADGEIGIPLAFIRGQKFDLELNRLMLPVYEVKEFDRLPIPLRAVAADIETGKEVVLSSGSLVKAIRASMAVPAVFDPVEIDGRLLVDGGIANNVPVSVAREMGADVLIVVDVGSGLASREVIKTGLDVSLQLTNFLFTLNSEQQIGTLDARDVIIRPPLGDIGGGSFGRVSEAILQGELGAREMIADLRRYSLSPEQYGQHLARRGQRRTDAPVIDFIRVDNRSGVSDEIIARRISAVPGEPLDVQRLAQDIGQIYGLEIFETVRYDLEKEGDDTGLVVSVREKSWGPAYVQFGFASSNDLQGDATVRFGLLYTQPQLNELNGEWRVGAQLGDEPGAFTEVHQPLDPLSRYFVSGGIGYFTRNINVFDDTGDMLARYQLATATLELGVGREFGTWGEGRLGYRGETGTAEISIGEPAPDVDVDSGEIFVRLSDDKIDDLYFPRNGHIGRIEYSAAREAYGDDDDYEQLMINYTHAFSRGSNTFIGTLNGQGTLDDDAPLEGLFQLGGFLHLSGLPDDRLSGQQAVLLGLIYMRRLYNVQFFKTYLGASLETGNVWQNLDDVSLDDSIVAGSLFLGFDTPIGPLYLAYGRADTDEQSAYIYLGPPFVF
jgi:NTE family protein